MSRSPMFANVMSCIAVFIALATGGAYAANTVFSEDIVDGEVKSRDILNETITSGDVLNNSLRAADIAPDEVNSSEIAPDAVTGEEVDESTLGAVPRADNANTVGFRTSAQLASAAFPTHPVTPCDPVNTTFVNCGSAATVEVDATSDLLILVMGRWWGAEAGPDSGACRIFLDDITLSATQRWGQAGNQFDSNVHTAALSQAHVFQLAGAGEHEVRVQCNEEEGDFRVQEIQITTIRLSA